MNTLPQEGDWRIVRLSTHRHHLQSLHHHPLIKILARGELTYGRGSASERSNASLTR
jgi:serine/threonine protein phosphatase PrpC